MDRKLILLGVIAAGWSLGAFAQSEQTYYVQSSKARILAAPTFSSKVIDEVALGQKLVMKGRQGSWIRVERNGREGYVSTLLVSARPPMARVKYIQAEDGEIKQGVRRRTSSFSSAAAARGLTKDDRKRADIDDGVDYKALYKMESFSVSENEVTQFAEGEKP